MHETLDLEFARGVQQHLRAYDVRLHKWSRIVNAAVNMALGGKVHHRAGT